MSKSGIRDHQGSNKYAILANLFIFLQTCYADAKQSALEIRTNFFFFFMVVTNCSGFKVLSKDERLHVVNVKTASRDTQTLRPGSYVELFMCRT